MPYCEIQTSVGLDAAQKATLCSELAHAFAEASSEAVAANIQFVVIDGCFVQFRGEVCDSAHIGFHPGSLTPYEDYPAITKAFLAVVENQLGIMPNRMYMNIAEYDNWGFDDQYITIDKHA